MDSNASHPLVGRGFLSFKKGKVSEQGLIISAFDTGMNTYVILQFMDWLWGDQTIQRIVDLQDLIFEDDGSSEKKTYRLFENNDVRNSYFEWKGKNFEDGAR